MASIDCSGEIFTVISCNKIAIYDLRTGTEDVVQCSKLSKVASADEGKPQGPEEGSDRILAARLSASATRLAACDDYKNLWLWERQDAGGWRWRFTCTMVRRGTSLTFSQDEGRVLVADKSGDLYDFSTSSAGPGELRLGHVSMLLDVVLVSADRYVVTADRDEKIRVSCFPNAYSVHAFCLAHTDFVSRLLYLEEEDVLLSGSGDGTLKLWNYNSGDELETYSCIEHLGQSEEVLNSNQSGDEKKGNQSEAVNADVKCLSCCTKNKSLAVSFDRSSSILIYTYGDHKLQFEQLLQLDHDVWSCKLDATSRLWVLTSDTQQYCHCLQYNAHTRKYERLPPDGAVHKVLTAVNKNTQFFEGADKVESIFPVLHKQKIDNVTEYKERKEQRLEEQKERRREKDRQRNKRRGKKGQDDEAETKKSRTAADDVEESMDIAEEGS